MQNFLMKKIHWRFSLFILLFLVFSELGSIAQQESRQPKKPNLVLAIVVDQFRYDYLMRFRADYHSGIERLLENGAVLLMPAIFIFQP
jgi:predicted AlkP superfamily pyrophosphatase or phosphodiesterase